VVAAEAHHGQDRLVERARNFDQPLAAHMGIIYKITSPSGKSYIGQTRRRLQERLWRHRDMKWGNCKLLKRAINKYGWERMQVQVLWTGPNELLDAKEIELIALHGTLAPHGYNSLPGGDVNPMSVQNGRDSVRESWQNADVRERHRVGRVNAWQDPVKRGNHIAARDAKREALLAQLPPEEREKRRAKLKRGREAQARWHERKRARHHADAVHLETLGVLADGAVSKEGQAEQKDSCTSSSDACSPNERMVGGDQAEATRGNLVNALCESDAESVDWF